MSMLVSNISFWFALLLSLGSLIFYLSGAIWNRPVSHEDHPATYDFNLGLPKIGSSESLFAIALVSAGTSLSTVFVFFLTAGSLYGWWLFICPIMFALGNWFMFGVYKRIADLGYFQESQNLIGVSGLVPYLGQRLTGNEKVGWLMSILSLLNLLAVLVLELIVGVEVIGYLARNTFGTTLSSWGEFTVFAVSILLLLGYVFVGGFRAVIVSDVWQMKAMKWAIALTLISIIFLMFSRPAPLNGWHVLSKSPPGIILFGFIINVILANLFAPVSQEASWQRFRAFGDIKGFHFKKALKLSLYNSSGLWGGLIIIALSLQLVGITGKNTDLSSISGILEVLRTLNDSWFPLFVFPIMTIASLSALYSTADTCVSALLYLIEYSRLPKSIKIVKVTRKSYENLPSSYYYAMLIIFLLSLSVYVFVRVKFSPTILQLVFSVFSNLVVIAPTVFTAAIIRPISESESQLSKRRAPWVLASLIIGFVLYWLCNVVSIIGGPNFLWLTQLSIFVGLFGSILPMLPVWLQRIK